MIKKHIFEELKSSSYITTCMIRILMIIIVIASYINLLCVMHDVHFRKSIRIIIPCENDAQNLCASELTYKEFSLHTIG